MPRQYTLFERIDGRWVAQFSDYNLTIVQTEAKCLQAIGVNITDLTIRRCSDAVSEVESLTLKLNFITLCNTRSDNIRGSTYVGKPLR